MNIKLRKINQKIFNPKEIETGFKLPFFLNYLDSFFLLMGSLIRYIHPILLKFFSIIGNLGKLLDPLYLPETKVVRLKEYLMILSDGAKLATDIYLPKKIYSQKGRGPTILVRLPYWKDKLCILGYYFASRGYITVLQDIRGCARSIHYGTNSLYMYERLDGKETLRWISNRFWYNGKIGMWGLSYLGITQLAVSWENEGLLTCIAPIHSSYANVFWHAGGLYPVGFSGSLVLIMKSISMISNLKSINFDKWDKEGHYRHLFYNPLLTLYNEPLNSKKPKLSDMSLVESPKALIKIMNRVYKTNVNVSQKDNGALKDLIKEIFYNRNIFHNFELSPYAFGLNYALSTPMLYIGGWYDMFIEHMLKDVKNIQQRAPEFFKSNFKMIIGPWSHVNLDKLFIKPLKPTHLRDSFKFFQHLLPFWWYEYWLKPKKSFSQTKPPLQIYILNKNAWKMLYQWPPKSKEMKLYLHSNGNGNSVYGDGQLLPMISELITPDTFEFDPSNPVITKGGRNLLLLSGPQNQLEIEKRKDILIYTSPELEEGVEMIGEVKILLYASTSVKDTDFMVKLVDVFPNCRKVLNIISSGIRSRYLEGNLDKPNFIEPNKIYKFEFILGSTAIYFPKNHKIRIEITSSDFPRFDVNSNLAGEISEIKYKIATQTIYHDKEHPSCLILPIYSNTYKKQKT